MGAHSIDDLLLSFTRFQIFQFFEIFYQCDYYLVQYVLA
jgi:hypothetical protein